MQRRDEDLFIVWKQDRVRFGVKHFAIVAFIGYVVWNASWLLCHQIPPSIWTYCTGLPCPTTGMTRSIVWLWRGDIQNCLRFNPFTAVYLSLTGISTAILLRRALQRRNIALPNSVGWGWLITLTLGGVAKFALGSAYW